MKIKIISDGTSGGTSVVNADTGEALEGVTRLGWEMTAPGMAKATIEVLNIEAVLAAECVELKRKKPSQASPTITNDGTADA